MNVVAIVQARLGSTRLPGKVLASIGGPTMLDRVVSQAQRIPGVWVLIATPAADAEIRLRLTSGDLIGINGDPTDVLRRYREAAEAVQADVIVRITSDCPLLDPIAAGELVGQIQARGMDKPDWPKDWYLSNTYPVRLVPDGCDVEMFSRSLLERVYQESRRNDPILIEAREHVTPLMHSWALSQDGLTVYDPTLRWTVDTEEDLEFVREVYQGLRGAPVTIPNVLQVTPADVCELCYQCVSHMDDRAGGTNWALHQIPVWNGRIFQACEAYAMAPWGGTRRRA